MKRWLNAFFLKSRKARFILAVLAFLIILIIVLVLFSKKTEPPIKNIVNNGQITRETQLARLNQDSDGDGLKDWEEEIYGTDPRKADTDGDKTPDGEEIKLGRDPLKPGPNDKIPGPAAEKKETSAKSENNLTQKIIDKFNEKFILPRLEDPSALIDNTRLSREVLKDLPADILSSDYFTEKDITILKSDSPENFIDYLGGFNAAVSDSFGNLDRPEIMIFSEALQAEDLSRLSILDIYLSAYKTALAKLKNLPVPPAFASLHLAYLNATRRQQAAVEKMRRAESDVIRGTYGAQEYIAANNEVAAIEQKLQKTLNDKKF